MIKKNNIHTQDWKESEHGSTFQRGHIPLTDMRDGLGLGCGAFRVKPGKRAFPKHAHLANDEAIFVVSGTGTLNIGDESVEVTSGDFVSLPRGVDYAHDLFNTGEDDLVYLCMSTMNAPEVVRYPDSDKLGVLEGPEGWKSPNTISGFYKPQKADYYEGED